jgi:predicted AAA+ superfamily ATPase
MYSISDAKKAQLQIEYYTTHQGQEVNFITTHRQGELALIQVCLSLKDSVTRHRELSALWTAMKECSLTHATVVTLLESESLSQEGLSIEVVPAWVWALK